MYNKRNIKFITGQNETKIHNMRGGPFDTLGGLGGGGCGFFMVKLFFSTPILKHTIFSDLLKSFFAIYFI